MPAKRLPWFKVWIGATSHGKVRRLDDGAFRTWVELLDAAAQQPVRGHFDDAEEAIAITRRPSKHIEVLVKAGLLDSRDDGLWLHDWSEWQDVYPSDVSRERSANTPPLLGEDSANTPRTLGDDSDERSPKKKKEIESISPLAPQGEKRSTRAKPAHEPLTEEQRAKIVSDVIVHGKICQGVWTLEDVEAEIDAALNHTSRFKNASENLYVRNWLRRATPPRQLSAFGPRTNGYAVSERIGPKVILDD